MKTSWCDKETWSFGTDPIQSAAFPPSAANKSRDNHGDKAIRQEKQLDLGENLLYG